MREMPKDERPYEKCARLGADSLSDVELLAVLLRTGTQGENAVDLARRVLYHAGENGILGIHQFNVERLKKIKGIGQVKAIQISCISELAKRLSKASYEETVCFTEPKTIASILYGRFKTRETGTYEIINVKLEGKASRRNQYFKRDSKCIPYYTERAFYRSIAEECGINYNFT